MNEFLYNPPTQLDTVSIDGIAVRKGDRVRILPGARADDVDRARSGRIGIVDSIEVDAEAKTQLSLIIEDDPGKDLGFERKPGHRFVYSSDEVEPLEGE